MVDAQDSGCCPRVPAMPGGAGRLGALMSTASRGKVVITGASTEATKMTDDQKKRKDRQPMAHETFEDNA